jgi:hypothetical protein
LVLAVVVVALAGMIGVVVGTRSGGSSSTPVRAVVSLTGVDPATMANLGFVFYAPATTDGTLPLATAEDDMRTAIGGDVSLLDAQLVDMASLDAPTNDPGRLCWVFVVRRSSLDARPGSVGAQPATMIVVIDGRSGTLVFQGP